MHLLHSMDERLTPVKRFIEQHISPLLLLVIRLKIGYIFFVSGWSLVSYLFQGKNDIFYSLSNDYRVSFMPLTIIAPFATAGEVCFGILLALGFFSRVSACFLMLMSIIMYQNDGHPLLICYILLSAVIVTYGAGKWSLDRLIWRERN